MSACLLRLMVSTARLHFFDATGFSWARLGASVISTAVSKFGVSSLHCISGTSDGLRAATVYSNLLSNGDSTVEAWFYPTSTKGGYAAITAQTSKYGIFLSSGTLVFYSSGVVITGSAPSLNTWHHVAVVRHGTTTSMYLDGVLQGTTSSNWSNSIGMYIGTDNSNEGFIGYIQDVRWTSGVARYTAAFTPPAAPFPTAGTPITSSLLHLDGTDGSTIITDVYGKSWAAASPAALRTAQAKFGTASLGNTGAANNGCINTPSSPDHQFGSSDFTLEGWFYRTGLNGNTSRFWNLSSDTYDGISVSFDISGNLSTYLSSNGTSWNVVSNANWATPSANAWHHLALVRNGANMFGFLDGVKTVLSTAMTGVFLFPTNGIHCIGGQSTGVGRSFLGYIDEVRITKNLARYTANFTPTGPFTE